MNTPNELQALTERRDYLKVRIAAKKAVGMNADQDERECWALTWAIERIESAWPFEITVKWSSGGD